MFQCCVGILFWIYHWIRVYNIFQFIFLLGKFILALKFSPRLGFGYTKILLVDRSGPDSPSSYTAFWGKKWVYIF
jgi:hypothetical protein